MSSWYIILYAETPIHCKFHLSSKTILMLLCTSKAVMLLDTYLFLPRYKPWVQEVVVWDLPVLWSSKTKLLSTSSPNMSPFANKLDLLASFFGFLSPLIFWSHFAHTALSWNILTPPSITFQNSPGEISVLAESTGAKNHHIFQSQRQNFILSLLGTALGLWADCLWPWIWILGDPLLSSGVCLAYLGFVFFIKSLASSKNTFSVFWSFQTRLQCLIWSKSSSRWASWAWQLPSQQ